MTEREIIIYLKKIPSNSWDFLATPRWSIKDLVAHMIGWTEIDVDSIDRIDEAHTLPWRQKDFKVDDYNAESVNKYSKSLPNELLNIWIELLDRRDKKMKTVGKEKIRKDKEYSLLPTLTDVGYRLSDAKCSFLPVAPATSI